MDDNLGALILTSRSPANNGTAFHFIGISICKIIFPERTRFSTDGCWLFIYSFDSRNFLISGHS